MQWLADAEPVDSGRRYRLRTATGDVSVARFVERLRSDAASAARFSAILAADPAAAFFFECPPVTTRTLDRPFEFVLLDAPALLAPAPDWSPFARQFAAREGPVVVFENLSGDALLVVPRPAGAERAGAHLAAFVREAPPEHVVAFWQVAAAALTGLIGARPVWLNTEGSGVHWLHLRIDSTPKYYHHPPYAREPAGPNA